MDAEFCMKFIDICICPINLRSKNVYKWTVSFRHIDTNDEMKTFWNENISNSNESTKKLEMHLQNSMEKLQFKKQIELWEKSISLQVNKMNAVNSWSDYGKLWWNDPNQSGSWVLKMILSLTKPKPLKCGRKAGDCCLFYCCLCFSCLIPLFSHKFIPKEALVMVGKIFLIKNQPFVCTPPKKGTIFLHRNSTFCKSFQVSNWFRSFFSLFVPWKMAVFMKRKWLGCRAACKIVLTVQRIPPVLAFQTFERGKCSDNGSPEYHIKCLRAEWEGGEGGGGG